MWENSSGKVNGIPENLKSFVLAECTGFKNNSSNLDDYEILDRTTISTQKSLSLKTDLYKLKK